MLVENKVQGGRAFTNTQKEKRKKIRGQADISLVHKILYWVLKSTVLTAVLFFEDLMEKMYNLASFLK